MIKDQPIEDGFIAKLTDLFERQVKSAAVGGGIKHFGPIHLKQMKISLPSLDEQENITEILSSIDDLIAVQNQKWEALQLHKKGLLQGLFPNVNEANA